MCLSLSLVWPGTPLCAGLQSLFYNIITQTETISRISVIAAQKVETWLYIQWLFRKQERAISIHCVRWQSTTFFFFLLVEFDFHRVLCDAWQSFFSISHEVNTFWSGTIWKTHRKCMAHEEKPKEDYQRDKAAAADLEFTCSHTVERTMVVSLGHFSRLWDCLDVDELN